MNTPVVGIEREAALAEESAKIRKLEIMFGTWWPYYALPYELRWTLFAERSQCPYCSGPLAPPPADAGEANRLSAVPHIDHMDPLWRGGEESIRNAVYACAACNLAKGRRLFTEWLKTLSAANLAIARDVYSAKHGHAPEAFVPGSKMLRLLTPRIELGFDEQVLRKMFPKPIVSGPPKRG